MPAKPKEVVALVLRVMLGCWFAYSGGLKIFGTGLDRFLADVANYRMVDPPLDAWVAYGVPWVELVAGVCLMLGILRHGALLAVFGLVLFFSVAVGSAWVRGLDISCGCHGGDVACYHLLRRRRRRRRQVLPWQGGCGALRVP